MQIRIKNNYRTNRLIQLLIIVGDFVVLWVLLYFVVGTIPQSDGWDEEKERLFWMVCTFAMVVAEYLFPSVIHERVAGANDILGHSTACSNADLVVLSAVTYRSLHVSIGVATVCDGGCHVCLHPSVALHRAMGGEAAQAIGVQHTM